MDARERSEPARDRARHGRALRQARRRQPGRARAHPRREGEAGAAAPGARDDEAADVHGHADARRAGAGPARRCSGNGGQRRAHAARQTPLPQPMPFHSDADEFDERGVRGGDEGALARRARRAGRGRRRVVRRGRGLLDPKTATTIIPPDELALRRQQARADSTLADPPLDGPPDDTESAVGAEPVLPKPAMARESAPSLPSPPEKTPRPAPAPRLLDTSPSPRTEPAAGLAGASDMAAKTKLGLEPARVEMARPAVAKEPAAAKRPSIPPPAMPIYDERPEKGPSNAPMIIGALAVVALVAGGVWFFVLRDQMNGSDDVGETAGAGKTGSAGSALASGGSAGSAVASAGTGSGSAAAENPHPTPAGVRVATVVSIAGAAPANAVIWIEDQSGPSPFTAQLEKGKSYKARVSAPGFVTVEVRRRRRDAGAGQAGREAARADGGERAGGRGDPRRRHADRTSSRRPTSTSPETSERPPARRRSASRCASPATGSSITIVDFAGATESADKFAMTMPSASLVVAPVVVQQPRPPVVHPPQTGSGSDTGAGSAVVTPPTDSGSQTDGPKTSPDSAARARRRRRRRRRRRPRRRPRRARAAPSPSPTSRTGSEPAVRALLVALAAFAGCRCGSEGTTSMSPAASNGATPQQKRERADAGAAVAIHRPERLAPLTVDAVQPYLPAIGDAIVPLGLAPDGKQLRGAYCVSAADARAAADQIAGDSHRRRVERRRGARRAADHRRVRRPRRPALLGRDPRRRRRRVRAGAAPLRRERDDLPTHDSAALSHRDASPTRGLLAAAHEVAHRSRRARRASAATSPTRSRSPRSSCPTRTAPAPG